MRLQDPNTNNKQRAYNRTDLPKTGMVRLPAVLNVVPVGRSTWLQGVKSGRFPPAFRLGPRTIAWRAEDIWKLLNEFSR